jgi:hypothetical protein
MDITGVGEFKNCRISDILYSLVRVEVHDVVAPPAHVHTGLEECKAVVAGKVVSYSIRLPPGSHCRVQPVPVIICSDRYCVQHIFCFESVQNTLHHHVHSHQTQRHLRLYGGEYLVIGSDLGKLLATAVFGAVRYNLVHIGLRDEHQDALIGLLPQRVHQKFNLQTIQYMTS